MVIKADRERIKTLLKDTITLLCKNGLNFKTEFTVEALIGITLDKEDVVLVSINEIIRSELGVQLALAKAKENSYRANQQTDGEDSEDSAPSTPASTNSQRRRKRKHSPIHRLQQPEVYSDDHNDHDDNNYGGGEGERTSNASFPGDDSSSEPPNKRIPNEANISPKKDYDSKDIVFIKEEVDTGDWPGGSHGQDSFSDLNIPPGGNTLIQHSDNFDFLHSGSLVPMSTASSTHPSWSESSQTQPVPGMNISPPRRTSTITGSGPSPQGDHSQQNFGQVIYSLASMQGCVQVQQGDSGMPKQYKCTICDRTMKTRRGFEAHMGQHLGMYRYNCSTCGKGFPSTVALKDHQLAHAGQKLVCPICAKQFMSHSGCSQHLRVVHQWSPQQVRTCLQAISSYAQGSPMMHADPSTYFSNQSEDSSPISQAANFPHFLHRPITFDHSEETSQHTKHNVFFSDQKPISEPSPHDPDADFRDQKAFLDNLRFQRSAADMIETSSLSDNDI